MVLIISLPPTYCLRACLATAAYLGGGLAASEPQSSLGPGSSTRRACYNVCDFDTSAGFQYLFHTQDSQLKRSRVASISSEMPGPRTDHQRRMTSYPRQNSNWTENGQGQDSILCLLFFRLLTLWHELKAPAGWLNMSRLVKVAHRKLICAFRLICAATGKAGHRTQKHQGVCRLRIRWNTLPQRHPHPVDGSTAVPTL